MNLSRRQFVKAASVVLGTGPIAAFRTKNRTAVVSCSTSPPTSSWAKGGLVVNFRNQQYLFRGCEIKITGMKEAFDFAKEATARMSISINAIDGVKMREHLKKNADQITKIMKGGNHGVCTWFCVHI